ncbi:hypothetical protein EU527_13800 [Candidatus Thorarchaeota archaeon]|nr:MAG: hypothetical protein EU527_13800 [Candidatus Thorarchaeota archaeon]
MSATITKKLFLISSFVVIIAGAIMAFLGTYINDEYEEMYFVMGPVVLIFGILFLLTALFSKDSAESKQASYLGIIMIFGSIIGISGIFAGEIGGMVSLGGSIFIILVFVLWPCFCLQGGKSMRSRIIGVASAYDSITISEISRITGIEESTVTNIIYDAIGKHQLSGKMSGNTFVRIGTTTYVTSAGTTKEREVVKVLVICPYCGAKTEQGIGKCQNCQADL